MRVLVIDDEDSARCAVAQGLRRRFPRFLGSLSQADLLAVAAGAGLAGGFA